MSEANRGCAESSRSTYLRQVDFRLSIANWCVEAGQHLWKEGDSGRSVGWYQVAAKILESQNRLLFHQRLERNLLEVGARLEEGEASPRDREAAKRPAWLHVMNKALPQGGHTSMAMRWIALSENSVSQSVALLSQTEPMPEDLTRIVRQRQGFIYQAESKMSVLERAAWLRKLARERASVVVLHVDPDDLIAYLAFSVPGGPPVMLVNHAAHIFWLGARVADIVVQCRGSDCENEWTRRFRGAPRLATVPIPLAGESSIGSGREVNLAMRNSARRALGIPNESPAVITVGDTYKFSPMNGISFHGAVQTVLRQVPQAYWVVVGVKDDGSWSAVAKQTGGRLLVLDRQPRGEMEGWRAAADVYAEGFPFGSTTALLEAGMQGLPVVLAPVQCPPPYGSDGAAIDHVLVRPASVAEYANTVGALLLDRRRREIEGHAFQRAVCDNHVGIGWRDHLSRAIRELPSVHRVYDAVRIEPVPATTCEYWMRFRAAIEGAPERAFEFSIKLALERGLSPRIGLRMIGAIRRAHDERRGRAAPWVIIWALCNIVFPFVDAEQRLRLLSELNKLFRPGSRTARTLIRILPSIFW